jgi:hypothetical protein
VVTCDLGDLAAGEAASVAVAVQVIAANSVESAASAFANETDSRWFNNSAFTYVRKAGPPIPVDPPGTPV